MYKLVIFDFDGTLADSARWMVEELTPLAGRFGFRQACEAEIEVLRGCDTRHMSGVRCTRASAASVRSWAASGSRPKRKGRVSA